MKIKTLFLITYSLFNISCAYLGNTYLVPHEVPIGETGLKAKSGKGDLEAAIMAQNLSKYFTKEELIEIDKGDKLKGDYIINQKEYLTLMKQIQPKKN